MSEDAQAGESKPAGSAQFRVTRAREDSSRAAPRDERMGSQSEMTKAAVIAHFSRLVGATSRTYEGPCSPGAVSIDVHAIQAPGRWVLYTAGMSERKMLIPTTQEASRYAELMLSLPSAWSPTDDWPVRWIRRIATFAHDKHSWLAPRQVVVVGEGPRAALIWQPRLLGSQAEIRTSRAIIAIYSVHSLTLEDWAEYRVKGLDAFRGRSLDIVML